MFALAMIALNIAIGLSFDTPWTALNFAAAGFITGVTVLDKLRA